MISFKANHDQFLCVEEGGGAQGDTVAGRPKGLLTANRTSVGAWETISVESLGDGLYALLSADGFYACCENAEEDAKAERDGIIVFNRKSAGAWETFRLWVHEGGGISFESVARPGWFIKAWPNGNVTLSQPYADERPVEKPGAYETFRPSAQFWSGRPVGSRPGIVAGRLAVEMSGGERNWLRNANGRFDYREAGAFSLVGHAQRGRLAHVADYLDRLGAKRFTAFREICTLDGPYWDGYKSGPHYPNFDDALLYTVTEAAARGLYAHVCLLGSLHAWTGQGDDRADVISQMPAERHAIEEWVKHVARLLRPHENAIVQIANEPGQIGLGRSHDWLRHLGNLVKQQAPELLLQLGAKEGPESDKNVFGLPPADWVSTHIERKQGVWGLEWIKRSGEMEVIDQDFMPTISGEPINFCRSRRDGRVHDIERQPMVAFAYGAVSRVRQYITNFHFDDALWCEGWDEVTEACMDAYHRGLDAVPMMTGDKWRGHWANDPWKNNMYPSTDGEDDTRNHVLAGRGPFRIFGSHNHSVVIAVKGDWDPARGLLPGRFVSLVDEESNGSIKVSVFKE